MIGTPTKPETPSLDLSRADLEIIHRLLNLPTEEHADLELDELPAWAVQLDREIRRQRMQLAARIVRRLAHDFGNILTGILGFSELALSDKDASRSPLHEYLSEVHRGAKSGARYTNQLRLFGRRQANNKRTCNVAKVFTEVSSERAENRNSGLRTLDSELRTRVDVQIKLNLPEDLPSVAIEAEALRQVLMIVLENAREAITDTGLIDVSARTLQVSATEAGALFGEVRPAKHVEIRVADNGVGLSPEVQRQLFAEPFFSTKSRQRGFGLAMAYGILFAHRGGLELLPRIEGGTIVRLVLPVAAVAGPSL